jgi:hypothetical protein
MCVLSKCRYVPYCHGEDVYEKVGMGSYNCSLVGLLMFVFLDKKNTYSEACLLGDERNVSNFRRRRERGYKRKQLLVRILVRDIGKACQRLQGRRWGKIKKRARRCLRCKYDGPMMTPVSHFATAHTIMLRFTWMSWIIHDGWNKTQPGEFTLQRFIGSFMRFLPCDPIRYDSNQVH